MSILWGLVPVSLLLLLLLWYAARRQATRDTPPEELVADLRPVDLEAFRNLMDPADEEFLRARLPAPEFRSVQRERLRAASEYVQCVSHNAGLLLRLGGAARLSADPEVAAAGRELVEQAIHIRWLSVRALAELRVGRLLPGSRISASTLIPAYQKISGLVTRIARSTRPAHAA